MIELIKVSNGSSDYPGNFTKEEIKVIKENIRGLTLHLFSGRSDIGDTKVDFAHGDIKWDVFDFLYSNSLSYETIILDPPYNQKFADKYQKLGNTPRQFIIFADTKRTTELFNLLDTLDPAIIILKSWNYYCLKRYKVRKAYLCYPGGFRKSTLLIIMERKQTKLF